MTDPATLPEALRMIEELRAERDHYRRELGLVENEDQVAALTERFGLSNMEARLVIALYARGVRPTPVGQIMEAMYAGSPDPPDVCIVRAFVWRVREKRGEGWIETVTPFGRTPARYRLSTAAMEAVSEALELAPA